MTSKQLTYRTYHVDVSEYPAAWGARAIHHPDALDIVPDRVDSFGSKEDLDRLFEHLDKVLPRPVLNETARQFRGDSDEAVTIFEDHVIKVVGSAQASHGYIYLTAVLKPDVEGEYRFPARAYNEDGEHVGPGPWLNLIHKANSVESGFFGAPDSVGPDADGLDTEHYAHAKVVFHEATRTVAVIPTDEHGAEVLEKAHALLSADVLHSEPKETIR